MPSISEPFVLSELPQASSPLSSRVTITQSKSKVHLGISHSSFATYSLRPTPHIIWSHSLPPTAVVTSISSNHSDNVELSEATLYAAVSEKKKHYLKSVISGAEETSTSIKSRAVPNEIAGIQASSDGSLVLLVLKSSIVKAYSSDFDVSEELWSLKAKASRTVIFHSFVSNDDLSYFSHDEELPENGLLVLVSSRDVGKKAMFEVRVVALTNQGATDLVVKDIEIKDGDMDVNFSLYQGNLYRYSPASSTLTVYNLPDVNIISAVKIPSSSKEKNTSVNTSILAVGKNKVLLSENQTLSLIDVNYESILSQRALDAPLSLVSYSSSSSMVTGISTTDKSAAVLCLTLDIGTGSLLESLSKGIKKTDNTWVGGFSDILIKKNYSLPEYCSIESDMITTSKHFNEERLNNLQEFKNNNQITLFEDFVVPFLKNEEWEDIEGDTENRYSKSSEFLVFEAEKDREVDVYFIQRLIELLFDNISLAGSVSSPAPLKLSSFVPEKTLIYLLTHPLFPTPQLSNILKSLDSYPRLLRQALVTVPALECKEVVNALIHQNDDIFSDAVNRLVEEFSHEEITKTIKSELYSKNSSSSSNTTSSNTISECVDRLRRLDIGWGIISCFVDAGGLFSWNSDVISGLSNTVNDEVVNLENSYDVMTLLEEALRKLNPTEPTSKITKKELKRLSKKQQKNNSKTNNTKENSRGPEVISQEKKEREQMKHLLGFGTKAGLDMDITEIQSMKNVFQRKSAINKYGDNVSRKVPSYTVEKLIL
ncbi:hypothetical protein NADFUDRAFT_71371 [Nadsonia fulvescens var. elongata DSM 6958]|uniref:U3 small nucleolar RNA-associated protein 8 n=1 Tax=Nadsonia fulvescens var. elongata DSM 6958 TaxID=857566 RepID=A0A1E3PHA1_9ASCO|nr:hypothetical protein NADFUDRAFT_71371 [Nadsonia fulvescens var. elongata DSM 6958]